MIWVAIVAVIGSLVGLYWLLKYSKLPEWSHRDVLAFIALIATIVGAAVLTLMKWGQANKFNEQTDRLITELVRERKEQLNEAVGTALNTIVDGLIWDIKLTSVGIIIVLLSLGLVISSRVIRGKLWGSEFELADGQAQREKQAAAVGARQTANVADDKADQLAGAAAAPAKPLGEGELPETERIK